MSFVNSVFCYAGLSLTITDAANSFIVYPTDSAQALVSNTGLAGTVLPPSPVSEPTLITINLLPDTFTTPGAGPLHTKLDQYPNDVHFTHQSDNNLPFTQPVTVAVCPKAGVPSDVRARLRLGHDASAGFEITPPADGSFLRCPTTTSSNSRVGFWHSVANAFLPKNLYAFQDSTSSFSGGVGGTAGEYSDFGTVDPDASFSGGVGGTAGEYMRSGFMAGLISGCTTGIEAPVGTPVDSGCLPFVLVKTPLGTILTGVPVTWNVTAGGGVIAPRSLGVCGTFGSAASTFTSAFGKTGICWTLGAAGPNGVSATPSAGGDAPAGTVFTPAVTTFSAIANPPAGVVFDQQPPSVITAGTPFTVTTRVVDKYGNQVLGSSDAVTLGLNQNTFAGGGTSVSAYAVQGYVTFSGLQINTAASGYTLTATSTVITTPNVPPVSSPFQVVPAAPASMAIVQGNNQTAASGTLLPTNPTVQVSDQYGNLVPGASVSWTPGLSSTASVTTTPTTTLSNGQTATGWIVGDGANQLTAAVVANPSVYVVFDATGTTTLRVYNQCATGGSGDPINDPNKSFAFWIPNPGNNKTIKEIQLYFSSAGKASSPTPVQIQLTTQVGTFDPAVSVPVATTTTVMLRGSNSETKMATFALSQPIVGSGNGPNVMIRLAVLSNPDGATISFNTGACSPGSSCKPPQGCSVSEVSPLTPYPSGTLYRKSVAITVKGP